MLSLALLREGTVGILAVIVFCGPGCLVHHKTFGNIRRPCSSITVTTRNDPSTSQTLQESAHHREPKGMLGGQVSGQTSGSSSHDQQAGLGRCGRSAPDRLSLALKLGAP